MTIDNGKARASAIVLAAVAAVWTPASGQQTYPVAMTTDEVGFEKIFDEKTLTGWEGDPTYWRVEQGALVGEVSPATLLKRNSFIIWRAGVTKDFELKLSYRISAQGNSGINYRSVEIPDQPWAMRGYQFDLDGPDRYTGNLYEERGRTFMAQRGQITRAIAPGVRQIIGSVGELAQLQTFTKRDDWNDVHIIARGGVLLHSLNGRLMCETVDDDPELRRLDGLLGVQVHVGPPMKVEYRNIRLKTLQ
jgi:hypothetical protein